jgi:teichuronic acid biosynthesis glycosyltransferase TuaC
MRVCVVAEYYPRPDDPVSGVWAHRQAMAARDEGCEIHVLALDRPLPSAAALREPSRLRRELEAIRARPRRVQLDGIDVEYVRYVSPSRERSYAAWHRYAARPLAKALRRLDVDLVHAHYATPAGAAVHPFTAARHIPLVVSVHGGDVLAPLLQAPSTRMQVAHVLRRAAAVLCNSEATRARVASLCGRSDHMRVVHLGTDVPDRLPPKSNVIATVGHVIPRKRHIDVLEALAHLPEVRWVVIGDGPELPRLRERAAALGLADRVELLGALPHAEAMAALARARMMVLPSVAEAFGVAYIEALAHGAPAIGAEGEGGPEEIAGLTDAMVLVPPRDPRALAAALKRHLADPAGLARLGEHGREMVRANFTWEACGDATVRAYREAL